jgi:hypothetical protein
VLRKRGNDSKLVGTMLASSGNTAAKRETEILGIADAWALNMLAMETFCAWSKG